VRIARPSWHNAWVLTGCNPLAMVDRRYIDRVVGPPCVEITAAQADCETTTRVHSSVGSKEAQ
jgi:hypothetical protein